MVVERFVQPEICEGLLVVEANGYKVAVIEFLVEVSEGSEGLFLRFEPDKDSKIPAKKVDHHVDHPTVLAEFFFDGSFVLLVELVDGEDVVQHDHRTQLDVLGL